MFARCDPADDDKLNVVLVQRVDKPVEVELRCSRISHPLLSIPSELIANCEDLVQAGLPPTRKYGRVIDSRREKTNSILMHLVRATRGILVCVAPVQPKWHPIEERTPLRRELFEY